MKNIVNMRFKVVFLLVTALTMLAAAAEASPYSNKWRIKVNHSAKSDGTIVFRVSPKNQPSIDVTVHIKNLTTENHVAAKIRDAFKEQLPRDGYHVERDDFEDVLIKKRGDTPNFGLELVSSSVEKVSIRMHKE